MKAVPIFVLCLTGIVIAGPFVNSPREVAKEQAARAFQTAGVHTKGIVNNVNELQEVVGRIKREMDDVHRALYAPRSPVSRLTRITRLLDQFQKEVPTAYDALLFEMDTVVMRAILQHTRRALYDMAGMGDTIAHIRDYAGIFAEDVLPMVLLERMRELSAALRTVARALSEIMQGGSVYMQSEHTSFAAALLNQKENIDDLTGAMRHSASAVQETMRKMQSDLTKMRKTKNALIRSTTLLQQRLVNILLKVYKGTTGEDLAAVGAIEVKNIMEGLHDPIASLIMLTADLVEGTVHGMHEGLKGITAFKTYIGFDVVNPVVRHDLDMLPDRMRELSRVIAQVRALSHIKAD